MKNKTTLLSLFLLFMVNTAYIWEYLPGFWDLIIILTLLIPFVISILTLIGKLFKIGRNKFKFRNDNIDALIHGASLFLVIAFPYGIIQPEYFRSEYILTAYSEGLVGSSHNISFSSDNKFYETTVYFGIDRYSGTYSIQNDTINMIYGDFLGTRKYNETYAIIKSLTKPIDKYKGQLILFSSKKDTLPSRLTINKLSIKIRRSSTTK